MRPHIVQAAIALTAISTSQIALAETPTPSREDLLCISLVRHACEVNLSKATCTSDGKFYACACGGQPSDATEIRTIEVFEAGQFCFKDNAERDLKIENIVNSKTARAQTPPAYYYKLKSGLYCFMQKPAFFSGSFQFLIACPVDVSKIRANVEQPASQTNLSSAQANQETGNPNQPSFDCSKAIQPIEQMICADGELSLWDGRLGTAYRQHAAQASPDARRMLIQEQRNWITLRRSECGVSPSGNWTANDLENAKPCLLRLTQARVELLNGNANPHTSPRIANARLMAATLLFPPDNAQFDHFPRLTVLQWQPVSGATHYKVEIQLRIDIREPRGWFNLPETFGFPKEILVRGTEYRFNFIGKQRGRWRITAVDQFGNSGELSPWREFNYLR